MWPLGRLSVRRKFQILGLCLLCIGAFLTLALVTRDARDQGVELLGNGAVRNQGGVLGAVLSGRLLSSLGVVGAWALPLVLVVWGWNRLRLKPALETGIRTALGAIGLLILLGFLHLITSGNRAISGGAGELVAMTAARLLGKIGGELVLGTALVVVGVIAFEIGSSQRARQALQAVLAFFALPFRKQKPGARPDEAPDREAAGSAAASATRGRKAPAIEEAEIASAWEAEAGKPRPPSRPRIVSRREEARGEPLSIPFPPPPPKTGAASAGAWMRDSSSALWRRPRRSCPGSISWTGTRPSAMRSTRRSCSSSRACSSGPSPISTSRAKSPRFTPGPSSRSSSSSPRPA
jgi:hypothetical protein